MATEVFEKAATLEDVLHEVTRIKSVVSDAVDEGVKSAMQAIKQGRHAAEEALDDAKYAVKQNPFQAMGIVFAAGVVTGSLVAWIASRRQ